MMRWCAHVVRCVMILSCAVMTIFGWWFLQDPPLLLSAVAPLLRIRNKELKDVAHGIVNILAEVPCPSVSAMLYAHHPCLPRYQTCRLVTCRSAHKLQPVLQAKLIAV
jgi:hypothetical protein